MARSLGWEAACYTREVISSLPSAEDYAYLVRKIRAMGRLSCWWMGCYNSLFFQNMSWARICQLTSIVIWYVLICRVFMNVLYMVPSTMRTLKRS